MELYGRRRIYTDVEEINEGNIVDVLTDALVRHEENRRAIDYLRWYVKGKQPILDRKKKVRKDVCNKVVENCASEVLDFKLGYIWGKPVNTIRSADADEGADVTGLIRMFREQRKDAVDQELALNFCIGGLGYRGVLPNPNAGDLSPFALVNLEPETTFCVYHNDVFRRKALGVSYIVRLDGSRKFTAYTATHRYELDEGTAVGGLKLVDTSTNGIGVIPIVEYTAPEGGFGCFEKAVPLLNAINSAASNRLDDVEQAIQSILWGHNTELDKSDLDLIEEKLAVLTSDTGDGRQAMLKYLSQPLDQTTAQSLVNDLYAHVLEICGVPGRESSAEATGSATEMGSAGWKKAQYSAERIVAAWTAGEFEMFRVILSIFDKTQNLDEKLRNLKITDLDVQFTLSKNNNILTKTQSLANMIQWGVPPRIAFAECDAFSDPESVYKTAEEEGWIDLLKQRLGKGGSTGDKETGDVTNQPKGDGAMEQFVENKGTVQKPD